VISFTMRELYAVLRTHATVDYVANRSGAVQRFHVISSR
jgi:hypothetical protein